MLQPLRVDSDWGNTAAVRSRVEGLCIVLSDV